MAWVQAQLENKNKNKTKTANAEIQQAIMGPSRERLWVCWYNRQMFLPKV